MNHAITYLDVTFATRAAPEAPRATDIALEAAVSEALATAFIGAAWEQAETFCGRCWRGIASGEVLIRVDAPTEYRWPRYPFPDAITAEIWSDAARGWEPIALNYRAGFIDLLPGSLYRLTQSPTDPVPAPSHVVQAVANLAIYQLIQSPARREMKSQTFGDTALTRENLMGALYGSGAGALLASEVRK